MKLEAKWKMDFQARIHSAPWREFDRELQNRLWGGWNRGRPLRLPWLCTTTKTLTLDFGFVKESFSLYCEYWSE